MDNTKHLCFSVMQVFKKQETSDYKAIFIYFLSNHKTQHHGRLLYPSFIVCPFFNLALANIQHSEDDFSTNPTTVGFVEKLLVFPPGTLMRLGKSSPIKLKLASSIISYVLSFPTTPWLEDESCVASWVSGNLQALQPTMYNKFQFQGSVSRFLIFCGDVKCFASKPLSNDGC